MSDNKKNNDIDDDYELSRETYRGILSKGEEALEVFLDYVKESESPRAFEVFANLMKSNAEIADKLMELQKKTKDVKKENLPAISDGTPGAITQNNIFVGDTTALNKALREKMVNKLSDE